MITRSIDGMNSGALSPQQAGSAGTKRSQTAAASPGTAGRDRVSGRRGGWLLLALSLAGAGCTVGRAASPYTEIPRERTTECQEICTKLDLQMSAVVVVLNTTGCVCEPRPVRLPAQAAPGVSSRTDPAAGGATPTARSGGAAIAAAQAVAQAVAQQQQRHQFR